MIQYVPIQSLHCMHSHCQTSSHIISIKHHASNLPIPSPPFSSFSFPPLLLRLALLFHLPNFPGLRSPPVLAVATLTFSLLAFAARPSCQPLRLSLAQAPQDEMYAPAFWPAACTDACAAVRSGARAAKRGGGGGFSALAFSLLGVPLRDLAS